MYSKPEYNGAKFMPVILLAHDTSSEYGKQIVKLVAKGAAENCDVEIKIKKLDSISVDDVRESKILVLGCPQACSNCYFCS